MSRGVVSTRSKFRSSQDSCGDCGSLDPGWASINRGILICDECCSVHRSLGRHTSQVKSLRKGPWHPSLLSMVQNLNNSGANNIWEYQLLDPSIVKGMRRKPQQKDPVHPTKADFIRAKHQMLSFVHKSMRDEGFSLSEKDVSKQMHASVRTPNLETTLRLLALGADPNYLHSDKGNCPLHVAARAGQAAQVELLVVYGADPAACDNEGRCPIDYAREGGFSDIVDRLMEFQYELTDRLTFYLCGRGPSHSTGQHFVIPEMADAVDVSMFAKEAKEKLVSLPNHLFEELSCDVFDEVDRRETDSIWLSLQNQSALLSDRCSVPFLPVNPEFSATRNQGRQKLARFNAREFATLIIDILQEAKSRMSSSPNSTLRVNRHHCENTTSAIVRDPYSFSCSFYSCMHDDNCCCLTNYPELTNEFGINWVAANSTNLVCNYKVADYSDCTDASSLLENNPLYASYDDVYTSSDEEFQRVSYGFDSLGRSDSINDGNSSDSEIKESVLNEYCSDNESRMGEGCMDLFGAGWSPMIGKKFQKKSKMRKKKKVVRKGNKSSSGFSSDSDNPPQNARSSTSTSFSVHLSKHLKEKLQWSKPGWAFGDSAKKMTIIHPRLRSDTLPLTSSYATSTSRPTSKSFLVRTLTMPLKYASQKQQEVLSKSKAFSRSQPTSPEIFRKVYPNFSRSDPMHHSMSEKASGFLRKTSFSKLRRPKQTKSDCFANQINQSDSRQVKVASSPTPYRVSNWTNIANMQLSKSWNADHMTSCGNSSLKPIPYHNRPILEPCATCAFNVYNNIQHASIWADPSNLPFGYLEDEEMLKLEKSKSKHIKDDCKLQ